MSRIVSIGTPASTTVLLLPDAGLAGGARGRHQQPLALVLGAAQSACRLQPLCACKLDVSKALEAWGGGEGRARV